MKTARRSGHNELRGEELVTWKVAEELMTLSISCIQKKGYGTQTHTLTHTQRERREEESESLSTDKGKTQKLK